MKLPTPSARQRWLAGGLAALLTLGVGLGLYLTGTFLITSYDLPFALRRPVIPQDVVMVYLDDISYRVMEQPSNRVWDRTKHAELIRQLAADGARAIVFDIVFSDPSATNQVDEKLRDAIKAHGKVLLAGDIILGGNKLTLDRPLPQLRETAAGWGLDKLLDTGLGAREHTPAIEDQPSLAWAAAEAVGAAVTKTSRQNGARRWINYYGPPLALPAVHYHQAYYGDSLPRGTFRDKIVFVGSRQATGFAAAGKDTLPTPFTWRTGAVSPGAEVHATIFLNLLRGDWLTRLPSTLEIGVLALMALAGGWGLTMLRSTRAILAALLLALLTLALAWGLFRYALVWFVWLIPLVQIGVGLVWSLGFNSIQSYIESAVLERSLALHLPERRVKQILKQPGLLAPSAEKQEVSLLFTDIADWSTISERITPERLFKLLNRYFQDTIPCIHKADGMVLNLIGDAIFAIWNAPEPQKDHQELACTAALKLRDQLVQFESANESYPLRTRAGLHCGLASVGNCGSTDRLVYTALGAETNMASRLEGLNKYLGTEILASDRIVEVVEEKFVWRNMGRFRLKGGDRVMEIYELVGALDLAESTRAWRQQFSAGLRHFQRAEWDEAEQAYSAVLIARKDDGPSRFYLRKIEKLRHETLPAKWFGEVSMDEK